MTDDEEAADAVVDERMEDRVMDNLVDEENTDQFGMKDEEAPDGMEDRVVGSKRRRMGDQMDAVDTSLDRGLSSGEVYLAHTPLPKDQDKGRFQMLLDGALVVKTNQVTNTEDPKDRRYKQFMEEMRLIEKIFTHSLKEIDMRDKRIVRLEDDLGKSEERNKLLRGQLERTFGCSRDTHHLGRPTPGHSRPESSFGEGSPYRQQYNSYFYSISKSRNNIFHPVLITYNL